jgi:TPR repeat protein
MAVIDMPAIAEFEIEGRGGKPNALYRLGLAYSTGEGVPLDLIAAHKYFNLAAMQGVIEARGWRAELAEQMPASDIAEAQRQARAWLATGPQ